MADLPVTDLIAITLASLGGMAVAIALALPHHLHLRRAHREPAE
ncbi:hypothetical protein [Novosphingobium huizhouense]|nr:hypothetical protein [Novosphingobium huizhouense]